jgi:hypothetical protein
LQASAAQLEWRGTAQVADGIMRRLLKFLHTIGAIGMIGAMACLLVLLAVAPAPPDAAGDAALRGAMGAIASWIFLPSLALTLVAGLLAMAANRAFHNAGWAWVKLATGVLVFEAGFAGVVGPMQDEATTDAPAGTIWVLLAIALLHVALGVWRPKVMRRAE